MRIFFIIFLIVSRALSADPWGKDADLATHLVPCSCTKKDSLLSKFGVHAIKFHQEVISPADGPRSHFIPSSSQYTLEAMQKHGFMAGYAMGCDRLMRENGDEWIYRHTLDSRGREAKWDPVP